MPSGTGIYCKQQAVQNLTTINKIEYTGKMKASSLVATNRCNCPHIAQKSVFMSVSHAQTHNSTIKEVHTSVKASENVL